MNTKILKCKSCNGTMEMDEERPILFCPYCGSKELVEESDDVIKARIDANTRLKETEKKLEQEKEIEKIKTRNDTIVSIIILVMLFVPILLVFFLH